MTTELKVITCRQGTHRNNKVVFLNFEFDKTLIDAVRKLGCAKWSQTNHKWCIPYREF